MQSAVAQPPCFTLSAFSKRAAERAAERGRVKLHPTHPLIPAWDVLECGARSMRCSIAPHSPARQFAAGPACAPLLQPCLAARRPGNGPHARTPSLFVSEHDMVDIDGIDHCRRLCWHSRRVELWQVNWPKRSPAAWNTPRSGCVRGGGDRDNPGSRPCISGWSRTAAALTAKVLCSHGPVLTGTRAGPSDKFGAA